MTRRCAAFLIIFCISAGGALGQVDEIKSSSSGHSESKGSSGRNAGNSGVMTDFFFNFMFTEIIHLQQMKLQHRQDVPSMVSLDLMLQAAAQPSSYYIINPRIRANWGLFSTDFRVNYIVEEEIGGAKLLRTNDWQILQLNLVTTRDVSFSVGGGVLQEAFESRQSFPEWTTRLQIRPRGKKLGGIAEYRNSEARREVNGHLHYALFSRGACHAYLTAGAVFQRYYEAVNVWGLQGGVTLSIY
jgi:hypothetical protein